jgi:hypothetical protein
MKKTRRNSVSYPALKPEYNIKIRQEYIDFDYIDKLNPSEKRWLNNFVEEELIANVEHPGTKLNDFQTKDLVIKKKKVHRKVNSNKKRIFDNNNARNRCGISKAKASGKLMYRVFTKKGTADIYDTGNVINRGSNKTEELMAALYDLKHHTVAVTRKRKT